MTIRRFSSLLVILVGLLAGKRVAEAQATGTLAGRVTGANGTPLAGATIFGSGVPRGASVRSDGSCPFVLPAGRHEIRVRLLGFA
jgi:hypothetical protein